MFLEELEYYYESEERYSESKILDIFEDIVYAVAMIHNKKNPQFALKLHVCYYYFLVYYISFLDGLYSSFQRWCIQTWGL
jgi:hypothetical protein